MLERYVSDTLARYPDIVKDEIFITHSGVSDEIADAVRPHAGRARLPKHLHHHGQLHHLQPLRARHPRHPVHDRNTERVKAGGRHARIHRFRTTHGLRR